MLSADTNMTYCKYTNEKETKQAGAELGQDQPGLGPGLKIFDLNNFNGG